MIGTVLIVVGLYLVLWGKSKELKGTTQMVASSDATVQQSSVAIEVVVHHDGSPDPTVQITTRGSNIIARQVDDVSSNSEHQELDAPNKRKEDV